MYKVLAQRRGTQEPWFFLPQAPSDRSAAEYLLSYYQGTWGNTYFYKLEAVVPT